MNRYMVLEQQDGDYARILLKDEKADALAELSPELGSNLFAFSVGGEDVLVRPQQLSILKQSSARSGYPILFPPNRVKEGKFTFEGKSYQLPINKAPDHSHGELRNRPWHLVELGADEERGAFAVTEFRFREHADLLEFYGHAYRFRFTYRVYEGQLILDGEIHNEGEMDAPLFLGFHPYFTVKTGHEKETYVKVPAVKEWPVDDKGFPVGPAAVTPVVRELEKGLRFDDFPRVDHNLVTLIPGSRDCQIIDRKAGRTIQYEFGSEFPFMIIFKPSWTTGVSLEPYTCITDAYNQPYEPEETGVRAIKPDEPFRFTHSVRVSKE